ncbi:N5-glutamine S-adenosyl-L-methionine-dependent methyltransferase [Listeria floridensis FSL S10-1187]|uniref:Release factor glutamine methyltransferase n=1 Tax=Listeria floridensis FSL S10-1187 TaxID=1265817 RepID=A0ABP3AYW3_9LIST|nr:peptide chain release factor N(5)-glutamine methyltransferase [Listeria floridensis]EUJ32718.1 N5-glutamine S-adenosyl-L-methionine-dependent methyltransferase [Listeria floridensis FSL S10-1187]
MSNKTILTLLNEARKQLKARNLDLNAAEILLETRLGIKRTELWTSLDRTLEEKHELQFKADFDRYLNGEPVQYILQTAPFYGYDFYVDENVLIPRPETEELVLAAEQFLTKHPQKTLLDVCTGSGIIAIALKKSFPELEVSASDISPEALKIAERNSQELGAEVELRETDLVKAFRDESRTFDVVLANPPYISTGEKGEMSAYVLANEPELALFAENDGLAIYERLAAELPNVVNERFWIGFEIGYKQGEAVKELLEKQFPEAKTFIQKDINQKDRIVVCSNLIS